MIEYCEEEVNYELFEEILPLLEKHKEEISIFKDVPLDVDILKYIKMWVTDSFVFYSAREDGELIGYSAYFISSHIHYKSLLVAQADVLFLKKSKRKGLTGVRLLKYSEDKLKELGVDKILQSTKVHYDLGNLLGRLGYEECDKIYVKEV